MDNQVILQVPPNLSLVNAISFCNQFQLVPDVRKIIFDFKWLGTIEPFSIAYVSCQIKKFANSRQTTRFEAANYKKHRYAAHMGFFKTFGLDYGNSPGQANGSSTYIPLTILETRKIRENAIRSGKEVGEMIEEQAADLARILVQSKEEELIDALTYSFREIMRNVIEHSESPVLEFCAQYWPTKNKVEIVVLDLGVGVKQSLGKNPYLTFDCDRDALQLSLLPGISGKMYEGVRRRPNDPWQNSGFGLYMTSRIARMGGSFFIGSGEAGIVLERGSKTDIPLKFEGTALRMVINTGLLGDLKAHLAKFSREGFSVAKNLKDLGRIESSTASMMLSKDFL